MKWINFLHIYQPSDQSDEILEKIVNESYRPLFKGLLEIPKAKINININGALTELLAKKGYQDVINDIKNLAESGQLEFTESAKYHALLPFLNKEEAVRQIKENHKTNRKYFGKSYNPVCFFPPEMAYSPKVAEVVSSLKYPLILIDQIAYDGGHNNPPFCGLFTVKNNPKLSIAFRERRISNSIMSAIVRNKKDFLKIAEENFGKNEYLCTAMDGETFGHHRPGLENSLFEILKETTSHQIFFSDLLIHFKKIGKINPLSSTWASTGKDIQNGVQFYSWKDPENKVHQAQWKLFNFMIETAKKKKLSNQVLECLDKAVASDQFFWASGEPWWSIEMIEKGAWQILQTLKSFPNMSKKDVLKAKTYYKEILSIAFEWQRSGRIEALAKKYKETVKIPFKERTLESKKPGEPGVYYAFIDMMKKRMKESAKNKNYEQAILWRDAIWKLETKNDIYDAIHVVDLLRMEIPNEKIEKTILKYKDRYERLKPGQPEQRGVNYEN